jgi:peroxiredoxin
VVAVADHLDAFGDAVVAVVGFAPPERLAALRAHLGVDLPFLADPDRRVYALLGAGRGRWWRVWSPGTLRRYARLVRAGHRLRRPTEDVYQLGADAVIGRDGRLRYLALPPSPNARPPVSALVAALD